MIAPQLPCQAFPRPGKAAFNRLRMRAGAEYSLARHGRGSLLDLHGTNFFYSVLNSGSWIACCYSIDPGDHLKSDVAPCCKLSCQRFPAG